MALVALALVLPVACHAGDGNGSQAAPEIAAPPSVPTQPDTPASGATGTPEATGAPNASGTPGPRARAPRRQVRHTPGQGIDETVHRLSRGLDLDSAQQTKLRQILVDEQMQMRKLRANPGAGVDWPSATAAIVDQTKARIRAMLNDDQKQKYSVDVPRDGLAPAQADLQHWMQLQESKRVQDNEVAK